MLTTILGIVGAFTAQFIGNALGFSSTQDGVGLIGAIIGAVIVLFVWGMLQRRNACSLPRATITSMADSDEPRMPMSPGFSSVTAV